MIGLIKKDFSLMRANLKSMIIVFVVYLVLALQGTFNFAFVVPLIGVMLFISTFSYDDFNNWNSYAATLPDGRKNVVKAKYLASIFLIIILEVICFILSIGINYTRTYPLNLEEIMSLLVGTILASVIIISLFYPIMFKFGSTNSRIILFSVIFILAGIGTIVSNFTDMNFMGNIINEIDNSPFVLVPIISIVLLSTSYLISNKIYKNREF